MGTNFENIANPCFYLEIPNLNLRPGQYDFNLQISFETTSMSDITDIINSAMQISVIVSDFFRKGKMIRPGHRALLDAKFTI
jgi:hypothetical protein